MLPKNTDKIIAAAAIGLAATVLIPIARSVFRPPADSRLGTLGSLTNRARSFVQIAKEELEDIVAEAQFERMKKRLDREIEAAEADDASTR